MYEPITPHIAKGIIPKGKEIASNESNIIFFIISTLINISERPLTNIKLVFIFSICENVVAKQNS